MWYKYPAVPYRVKSGKEARNQEEAVNPFKPKKDEEPRTLYAKLHFAEAPFEDGHSQKKCTFSFRVVGGTDVFPHSYINVIQTGEIYHNRHVGQLHFWLVVCLRSNYDDVYTGVLRVDKMTGTGLPICVGITEGNRWLQTMGTDIPATVSKGIAQMFLGHPKLHRFLFGAEQKR